MGPEGRNILSGVFTSMLVANELRHTVRTQAQTAVEGIARALFLPILPGGLNVPPHLSPFKLL